ncbi:retrovirus-related pol polyprotein from transposon TNT 1-94 [Tanacetum coccineum]
MTKLTQKKVKFEWGDKQEAAFQLLKQKLCSAPILALPEGSKDFIAYCDALKKELGALVFALKIWRHYLYGTKCTVFTDHKSLQHILDQKEQNMRQRRWLELLSDYDHPMALDTNCRFTNTSVDEIKIDDSSRYPLDEFLHEDDPSRQYQANSNFKYYIIPNGHSLTKLTKENHVPEVIAPNEQNIPQTEDIKETLRNNIETSVPITEPLVPKVPQSQDTNHASTSSYLVAQDRWSIDQQIELMNIIGDLGEGMLIRSMAAMLIAASTSECLFADFLFEIEPKKVNKKDEHGIVTKNKARLVAQAYSQEKGIDYDETFAPCLLEWKIKRRSLCETASWLESSEFPDYVYKLDKSLYGLKQALWAWYETLSTFCIQNKFVRGRIDNTLIIYRSKGEVLLVQVYVDDIIFGSTSYKLCKKFEKLMTKKFEISMMGELTYFLELQIKHDDKGISIYQEQYTRNLLKKYEFFYSSSVKTPMVPPNNLGPDLAGFDLREYSYSDYAGCNITEKAPQVAFDLLRDALSAIFGLSELKHEIRGFHDATFKANENTNTALRNYQQILNLFKTGPNTGLKRILKNLKEVQDAVKEDPAMNKKVLEATVAFTKLLALVNTFDFSGLKSIVESLKAIMDAQNDHLAKWAKSSTNLAWSDSPPLLPQAVCQQQHLLSLKVQQLLGENFAHIATEELMQPPSYTEEEKADMDTKEAVKKERTKEPKVENVEKETTKVPIPQPKTQLTGPVIDITPPPQPESPQATPKPDRDPDTPIRVPYMIHRKMYQLTKDEIQAHLYKEEKLEQVTKEAMLNKPELIKVVQEEATKAGVDPKILASAKGGQEFKKIQDAEIKVLNKVHS